MGKRENVSQMGLHRVTEMPYLSRGIHNLRCIVLAVVLDNPAEGILDRGVVAFHEMLLDKADSERGLAYEPRKRRKSITVRERVPKGRWRDHLPTERLPTIAIFLCLGAAGILTEGQRTMLHQDGEWGERD